MCSGMMRVVAMMESSSQKNNGLMNRPLLVIQSMS